VLKQLCFLLLIPVIPALVMVSIGGGLPVVGFIPAQDDDAKAVVLPGHHIRVDAAFSSDHEGALWIDARRSDLFEKRSVPGAVWCSENDWERGLDNLLETWDGEQSLIIFCDGKNCSASDSVAKRLREELELDEAQVFVLHGGWDAYQQWERSHGG